MSYETDVKRLEDIKKKLQLSIKQREHLKQLKEDVKDLKRQRGEWWRLW